MTSKKTASLHALALCTALLISAPALAQQGQPRLVGTYGDWDAYIYTEDGKKVCYMASLPEKAEGSYSKRGEVFALLTHRPADGTKNVFSYITGYDFKEKSEALLKVGDKTFNLFTKGDTAWAPDAQTDEAIAQALRSGEKMVVTGVSARGTNTKDTFSLKGSSGAYEKISQECR